MGLGSEDLGPARRDFLFPVMHMRLFRYSSALHSLAVVLGLTVLVLILSAILLPPKDSRAMPRDDNTETPITLGH